MSKKMKIPSIFNSKEANKPWQWPSCKHPKTLSFRERDVHNDNFIFKTVNSVYLDPLDALETSEPIFTNSNSDCARLSSTGELENDDTGKGISNLPEKDGESLDTIIHGVRSTDRLFFEPDDTGSLLKEDNQIDGRSNDDAVLPFKQSVELTLDSDDPYLDFKRSMQEMVETHGLKDWDCLEELLGWYLKVNEKTNHGIIVGAFIDVLIGSVASPSCTNSAATTKGCCSEVSSSYSSAESCFSSPSSPVSTKKTSNVLEDVTSH